MFKKILKVTLIVFIALIAVAFAAPFLFKGKLMAIAKKEINKSLNAKVDFKDLDISFFRHFPRVSAALENLQVIGIEEFEKDTLLSAKQIDIALDLMSVIKGTNMKVYSVTLDDPRIHAIVTKEGKANWDIMKPEASTAEATDGEEKPFSLELQQYSINNGYISYVDDTAHMSAEIININHSGSGDFTSDLFILKTKTKADAVSFNYGGIPYLFNAATTIDADIQVDNKQNKYTFKTDNILVNNLKLAIEGFFQLVNDSTYGMDIKFNAPSTEFKDILSLVPAIYKKDFDKIKTGGTALFNGFVKGTYSSTQIPAYSVNMDVKNGFFQYPDLPKPVKNINLTLKVNNPDGITDNTVIDIPVAHLEMGEQPFDFRLLFKNPVSDRYIDATAKGNINLAQITQFVKLDPGTKLSGNILADVTAKGNLAAISKGNFYAAGYVNATDFNYASKDYPDGVKLSKLLTSFNPVNITIKELTGGYKNTHFSATGTVNNAFDYVLKDEPLNGAFQVKADNVNVNELMGTPSPAETTAKTSDSGPFLVPKNMAFTLNATADKVKYDNIIIENLTGKLLLKNETVQLEDVKGNTLGGTMIVDGSYSTQKNKLKPDISLSYDVQGLDIQKTFLAFNTVQKLMPIAQFLSGKLSSQLNLSGKLGETMMPDLSTLSGKGALLMIEGVLNKFTPMDRLASTLQINELRNFSLRDIKTWFEFSNGKVLVKPFKIKVKDIEMEIGGIHGLDQTIDYVINMKLPRALLGTQANNLVNNLASQAVAKGIPVKIGDMISLNIGMAGTIKNPAIKLNMKEAGTSIADDLKKQAADFAQAKIDSAKKVAKDTLNAVKNELLKNAKEELLKKIGGKKDTVTVDTTAKQTTDPKKRLEDAGKNVLKNIFNKKKPAADSVKKE